MIDFNRRIYNFELVLQIRDGQGNPTGKTKSYKTDDSDKLWQSWIRHNGVKKHKRRKTNKGDKLPDKKQAEKILKEIFPENGN